MHENAILVTLQNIQNIKLCHVPECEAMDITKFYSRTKKLCQAASNTLDQKSQVIEKVVNEIFELLLGPEVAFEEADNLDKPGARAMMRKKVKYSHLKQEAESIRHTYEHMLFEAQVKLLRSTLEVIRRRLAVKMVSYGEKRHEKTYPLFYADLILAIPDVVMIPSLDGIQKGLNNTVNTILLITKTVYRWGQVRDQLSVTPEQIKHPSLRNLALVLERKDKVVLKNFHRMVSEHKEIQKLVIALMTAVNSTKNLKNVATSQFTRYSHLWTVERELKMEQFLELDPTVNEFSIKMCEYSKLVETISMEPEVVKAGPLALRTEKLKFALNTEAKAWVVSYGHTMNTKYKEMMESVFSMIDDWSKKLSHPLKDMDDIRSVMGALKEIRENELEIDMSIDPIEVIIVLVLCI